MKIIKNVYFIYIIYYMYYIYIYPYTYRKRCVTCVTLPLNALSLNALRVTLLFCKDALL